MKKYLLILLALLPMMLFTACSSDKEEETPNALVGTTWQYFEKEGDKITSMTVLEFKSNTVVKIIGDDNLDKDPTKKDHEEKDATYVLNGNKISIKRDIYSAWGEIDGDKMMLQFVDDGKIETMVFTKR
nr:hypothetical protein [uncultured Prevotella sp.]